MVDVPKLSVSEMSDILTEIQYQPAWRREADKVADYIDGNQIDSPTLQAMQELGIAPIVENLMGPTIDAVLGQEAKNRLDFRVTPASDDRLKDMAEAMNQKLNEAERESKTDRACADAFASQVKVGIGWVMVGMEHDPFKYPHKSECVHRNEVFWDFKAREPDLTDARFVVRKRWYDADQVKMAFPDQAELIGHTSSGWASVSMELITDGGKSTGLAMGVENERAWTVLEQEWRDTYRRRLCLAEVWYRRWVRGKVLKAPDGRVVEYDERNPDHIIAVQSGMIQPQDAMYSKVRLSWWVGPHCLADIENPYKHGHIPYVPFFGKREDMTGIPYGLGRPMVPMQDEINARNSKMVWLLSAKRVTMTKGVADPNHTRNEAARPDAVHVLDPAKMREGGIFKIETDFQLNSQQYQALVDKRASLKNVAGVYAAFEGQNSNATSGRAINSLVDQSTQTLADIYDNYRFARAQVGNLLLSNVIQEMGTQEVEIKVKSGIAADAKVVVVNQRTEDGGINNDIQRAMLKVALSDVPTTASFRQQQNAMFAEILKSLPPEMQANLMDFYLMSTDMPDKERAVERVRKLLGVSEEGQQPDPQVQQLQEQLQQMQGMLQQAQEQAHADQGQLADMQMQLKNKAGELDIKRQELSLKMQEAQASTGGDGGVQAQLDAEKVALEHEKVAVELRAREIEREIALAAQASAERIKMIEREMAAAQAGIDADAKSDKGDKGESEPERDEQAEIDAIVEKVTANISPSLQALLKEVKALKQSYRVVRDGDGNISGFEKVLGDNQQESTENATLPDN